jgi:predicted transposase YbfD/YdcC
MDIKINLDSLKDLENSNFKIDAIKFQKMLLLYNSIEQGWSVKKHNNSYVFSKKHEGKKEVLEDTYLLKFMKTNLDFNKIIS